jgi:hypothetical protein
MVLPFSGTTAIGKNHHFGRDPQYRDFLFVAQIQ